MANRMSVAKMVWWWKYLHKESCSRIGAFWSIWSPVDSSRRCLVHWYCKIASWIFRWNAGEKIWPQDGILIELQFAVPPTMHWVSPSGSICLWIPNKETCWRSKVQSETQILGSRNYYIFDFICTCNKLLPDQAKRGPKPQYFRSNLS